MNLPNLPQVPFPEDIQGHPAIEHFVLFGDGDKYGLYKNDGFHVRSFSEENTAFEWVRLSIVDRRMNIVQRNKRGDLLAVFLSPMTPDKWQKLLSLSKLSRRFEIDLPNGYRLKYGQHLRILEQNPKNFGQYLRIACNRYC